MEDGQKGLTRRELLKAAGAAAAALPLAGGDVLAAAVAAGAAPLFFTRDQLAMVDELAEMIIPADEHSQGARAAGCAAYIDSRLADSVDPEPRQQWLDGLARVDAIAQERKGAPFMQLSPDDRLVVVTLLSADEENRTSSDGRFFRELKGRVAHAYYTSKIGLHDDLEYKGNTMQDEYSGIDVSNEVKSTS